MIQGKIYWKYKVKHYFKYLKIKRNLNGNSY